MLKSIFTVIVFMGGMTTAAHAQFEIQAMGSYGSLMGATGGAGVSTPTSGQIDINNVDGFGSTNISLGTETYYKINDKLQVGGILGFTDLSGDLYDGNMLSIGALARFNLDQDFASSIFIQGGIRYMKINMGGDGDNVALLAGVGKRIAISENVSWTPNLTLALNVAGDVDKGTSVTFNFVSVSFFYNK